MTKKRVCETCSYWEKAGDLNYGVCSYITSGDTGDDIFVDADEDDFVVRTHKDFYCDAYTTGLEEEESETDE